MALAATGSLAGPVPAASAHATLTEAEPPAGAVLTTGPDRASARFSEELRPVFAAMTVIGPDGRLWSAGDPAVEGPRVSVAVRPLGPAGRYTVNYRVTSADGHPVSGSWSFTVTAPGSGTPGPAVETGPGAAARTPVWVLAAGAAALLVAAVVWGLRRRR